MLDKLENTASKEKKSASYSQTRYLNDGFLKLIWQLNGCLSLRLDADMLSITQISSERGVDSLFCQLIFFFFVPVSFK